MRGFLLTMLFVCLGITQSSAQLPSEGYWCSIGFVGFSNFFGNQLGVGKSYYTGDSNRIGFHPSINMATVGSFKPVTFADTRFSNESEQDLLKTKAGFILRGNLRIDISYHINKKFTVGVGTDLLGLSDTRLGKGTFIPSEKSKLDGPTRIDTEAEVKASRINVWSANGKGRGSWQSDIWVLQKRDVLSLKHSVSWMQNQLTTLDVTGLSGNKVFNYQTVTLGVAVIWKQ